LIETLKERPPPNSVILSFDEKGKTPIKHFPGKMWTGEKNYRIPYGQKVRGLVDLFAVKNIHTGKRHYKFYDWKNSFIVIDFIDWILKDVYPDNDIYIIHDGWSAHRSNAFRSYADLQPRLHLVPLPTCSSWMNDIERDFSRIQNEVLDNSNFDSTRDAINTISVFIEKELNSG